MDTLTPEQHRAHVARSMSEETFLAQIKRGCADLRRLVYHTRQVAICPKCGTRAIAKGSDPGFPDLVIPVPPVLYLAELKTMHGELTPMQERWAEQVLACRELRYEVWRPCDDVAIATALLGRAP